jgi:3-dehydroquinate dehydratase II
MLRILIVNGPNLDLLGTREPQIYGSRSFDDYLTELRGTFPQVVFAYSQSNVEGELVDFLRRNAKEQNAVILNPAGYSHTSVALRDTIAVLGIPVVEVHISNIHGREEFRHNTITGGACAGVITGFGLEGYRLAVLHLLARLVESRSV